VTFLYEKHHKAVYWETDQVEVQIQVSSSSSTINSLSANCEK